MSSLHPERSNESPPNIFWLLLSLSIILVAEMAAIGSIIIFFLPSYLADLNRPPFLSFLKEMLPYLVAPPLAGWLAGFPLWWLIVEHPRRATELRGGIAGVLSSILAHPFMWMIILGLFPSTRTESAPEFALIDILQLLLALSLSSLIYVGWMTALLGGIAGVLLIHLRERLLIQSMQQEEGSDLK